MHHGDVSYRSFMAKLRMVSLTTTTYNSMWVISTCNCSRIAKMSSIQLKLALISSFSTPRQDLFGSSFSLNSSHHFADNLQRGYQLVLCFLSILTTTPLMVFKPLSIPPSATKPSMLSVKHEQRQERRLHLLRTG